MSPKRPESMEELNAWFDEHGEDHLVDGKDLIEQGSAELTGAKVPGDLYDNVLLVAYICGLNKSAIGTYALLGFINSPTVDMLSDGILGFELLEFKTPFRAYLSMPIYRMALELRDKLGWNSSQLMTAALSRFVNNHTIVEIYDSQIQKLIEAHNNMTREEIERKIFSSWKYASRVKRQQESLRTGKFVSDRKMP